MPSQRNAGYIFVAAAVFFAFAGAMQFVWAASANARIALGVAYGVCSVLYVVGAASFLKRSKQ